jgi:restriction system protein
LLGATGIGGLVKKLEHRRLLASARQLDDLRALTPRAFEELVLAAYRRQRWSGSLTGHGADGGVDVILQRGGETVYVQCKRWTWQTIPVEAVRALKGSMATQNVARGIFVCCGRFTAEAQRFAASTGITTVGGEALLDLIRDVTGAVPSTSAARETRPAATTAAPTCPRCQVAMVRRTGRHGEFWGCAGFPGCRATRPLETSRR